MLEEAEILMSKLHFSTDSLDQAARSSILDRAAEIYQNVSKNAGANKMASGMAMMGLALIAENREEWDKARTLYKELADDNDQKWTGTPYLIQATLRLPKLDEWEESIVFSPQSEPVQELEDVLDSTGSDLEDSGLEQ